MKKPKSPFTALDASRKKMRQDIVSAFSGDYETIVSNLESLGLNKEQIAVAQQAHHRAELYGDFTSELTSVFKASPDFFNVKGTKEKSIAQEKHFD